WPPIDPASLYCTIIQYPLGMRGKSARVRGCKRSRVTNSRPSHDCTLAPQITALRCNGSPRAFNVRNMRADAIRVNWYNLHTLREKSGHENSRYPPSLLCCHNADLPCCQGHLG